jgi:hypothetical protein
MHYELRSNRVKMFMPEGGEVAEEEWFNMLLVHQNRWVESTPRAIGTVDGLARGGARPADDLRVKHGPQQSVPEGMFDDSIKLVVYGQRKWKGTTTTTPNQEAPSRRVWPPARRSQSESSRCEAIHRLSFARPQ